MPEITTRTIEIKSEEDESNVLFITVLIAICFFSGLAFYFGIKQEHFFSKEKNAFGLSCESAGGIGTTDFHPFPSRAIIVCVHDEKIVSYLDDDYKVVKVNP